MSFYLIAGEASGDSHGAALLCALKDVNSKLAFSGIGGPKMRKAGLKTSIHAEQLSVMGFTDVLKRLPSIAKIFISIRDEILAKKPDAVIFIDYPGFNLRLATGLRKRGYRGKLIQYVAPTVWAWGKGRIQTMAKSLDLLLTIFPFEPPLYAHTSLKVLYVGNPLIEEGQRERDPEFRKRHGIDASARILSLFPGSREGEIRRNFPAQLAAAKLVREKDPNTVIAVSLANPAFAPFLQNQMTISNTEQLMLATHTAIATSGTVTTELALASVPTVVTYGLSPLNYFIGKYFIRTGLTHFSMPNILAKKEVFPEWIDKSLSIEAIAKSASTLHFNKEARLHLIDECRRIRDLFTDRPASKTTAEAILGTL